MRTPRPGSTVLPRRLGIAILACVLPTGLAAQPSGDVGAQHGGIGDSVLIDLPRLSLTPCAAGLSGIYPCSGVDLLSFVPGAELAAGDLAHSVDDLWGWTDPETGREYVLVALDTGVSFVDATDPEAPVVVGYLPSHTAFHPVRDVKVHGGHAFVISQAPDHGLQVFDLARLRDVAAPPVSFEANAHYAGEGLSWARSVVANEASDFIYVTGSNTCDGGLHAVDVNRPEEPVFAGCASAGGFVADAQCVSYSGPDAEFQDHEICFTADEDSFAIVDVTDKASPVELARGSYPGVGYTHQGWTTEDRVFLLLGDEQDETLYDHDTRTYVWNVSRLRLPALIGAHTSSIRATDNNRYVVGNRAYLASYTAGLRIFDLGAVAEARLSEVAFYDVVPGAEAVNRFGAVGVYPFFPSGVVALTATRQGLFLLDVQAR